MKRCKECKLEKGKESFVEDIRYKDGLYPTCRDCLESKYTEENLAKLKTCEKCHEDKPLMDFKRKFKSLTGFDKYCKSCVKSKEDVRKRKKPLVSVADTKKYLEQLKISKIKFECKTCEKVGEIDEFYHKRDFGRVYIVTTRCRECEKFSKTLKEFGLSREQFNKMMEEQNHCCKICEIPIDKYRKQSYRNYFAVDHCHNNGQVRGLLCDKCNRALGFFKDDIENLKRAITYLSS